MPSSILKNIPDTQTTVIGLRISLRVVTLVYIKKPFYSQPSLCEALQPLFVSTIDFMQIVQLLKSYSAGRRDFSGVDFREAWMPGLKLNQAILQGADLTGSNLSHSLLQEVDFSKAMLWRANLNHAQLRYASFERATLIRSQMAEIDLQGSHLVEADLRLADLRNANLSEAKLNNAQLCYANLTGSCLHGIDFRTVNLTGAILADAHLSDCHFTRAQMESFGFSIEQLTPSDRPLAV